MSNEKRSASNSIRMMLVGVLLTDVKVGKTTTDKPYATFMLSGEGDTNYWVRTFNERLIDSVQKNIGKKSVVSVVAELAGVNKANEGYKPTISVNAKSIDFISNFGENRNSESQPKNEKWGSGNNSQPQNSQPQPQAQNQPQPQPQQSAPADFDDDIPF
jgi:single-stranded DNA-binding protein